MKKYKRDIYKAIGILVPCLLAGVLSRFDDAYFAYLCFTFYFLASSYALYAKIRYRYIGANHVFFPTLNDDYTKTTTLVFGLVILIGAVVYGFYMNHFGLYVTGICLLGTIIFLNGLYDLPNGELKIKNGFFRLYGLDNKIDVTDIDVVEIYSSKIVVVTSHKEKLVASNFAIDERYATLIRAYVLGQTNGQTIVLDCLSNTPYLNTQS